MSICCFTFRHQLVPHSVPNFSPVPLCNVSWGLGECSVLVRSVSPCIGWFLRSVCFLPLPALSWPLARRLCPLFLFLLPFRPGSGRVCVCVRAGVCVCVWVCNVWIDVKLLQGVPGMHTGLAPTKTPVCHLWYRRGCSSTYLLFEIYCNGTGLSREPQPRRFYFDTVATIWSSLQLFYLADMAKG